MEFATESERQQWITEENKRVAQRNKEVLDNSAAAVARAREERDKELKNEPSDVAQPPGRRFGRVPDGTAVATPAGPGDDEDAALGEFDDGDDEEFDDEDDPEPDEDEDDED